MSFKKGDIVLVPFPFTDLSSTKLRPAVILWVDKNGNDVIVCLISSQNLTSLTPEEFVIEANHVEFSQTGLKVASKVRVSRIVTIEKSIIVRRIGILGITLLEQLNICLKSIINV